MGYFMVRSCSSISDNIDYRMSVCLEVKCEGHKKIAGLTFYNNLTFYQ